ncbi:MAG: TIGR03905 family TSCPD domain-containing protein [Clostridia bacterium]|nr:TIGR03905 family TSCPD domain-containing protein [Clostridia bacterium]MBR4576613.1 TIGR03905 family TSCPD domain-containing protein [Clostridia bacterium]
MYHYQCKGTCSTSIDLEIQDGIITYCKINNGCRGNTQGVAKLALGRKADEVAEMLQGIPCRGNTSCPDQLSQAIRSYHD